jgi:hypothetical protein
VLRLGEGVRVRVCGEASWADGVVLEVRPAGELPAISGAPDPAEVSAVLAEVGCVAVALIGLEGREVTRVFPAFLVEGVWHDVEGCPLDIVEKESSSLIR